MGTPVDINFEAVQHTMKYLGVVPENRAACFKKVIAAARHVIQMKADEK